VPALIGRLRDKNSDVRWAAVWALGETGSPEAVEALVGRLDDKTEDREVREEAAGALGTIGSPKAVEALAGRLQDVAEDREVREEAAVSLGQIGSPEAVDVLTRRLADENDDVRQAARWALTEISSSVDAPVDRPDDKTEDREVREEAAVSLGQVGSPGSVDVLIGCLEDKNRDVRLAAAEVLERIGWLSRRAIHTARAPRRVKTWAQSLAASLEELAQDR
jgi:HEAT repeat protein